MKKFLSTFLQFFLFLLTFAIGSFAHPFNLRWGLTVTTPTVTRYFVPDGLLLMVILLILILIMEALMKRLRTFAPWTALAFVLAAIVGYAMKLGFITRDL
ncbi:hypothetical protein EDE15_2960 [Edaphobacter aggregans]|uniref:Uncharacterized protein n=1 Tax=Edaphobacter aggregans TaxID=570835 RepID=A0A428MKM7_9BACT|nr:hypothetical protein [Edaphobacter aggregans]RSL17426.1 hypothetical protein EDE15_2960 [Edaphobacter aggregans]